MIYIQKTVFPWLILKGHTYSPIKIVYVFCLRTGFIYNPKVSTMKVNTCYLGLLLKSHLEESDLNSS